MQQIPFPPHVRFSCLGLPLPLLSLFRPGTQSLAAKHQTTKNLMQTGQGTIWPFGFHSMFCPLRVLSWLIFFLHCSFVTPVVKQRPAVVSLPPQRVSQAQLPCTPQNRVSFVQQTPQVMNHNPHTVCQCHLNIYTRVKVTLKKKGYQKFTVCWSNLRKISQVNINC